MPSPAPRDRFGDLAWFGGEARYGGERIGEVERSATCDTLSEHFAAGRLSAEDLELRLSLAVRAVTQDDLRGLVADLPSDALAAASSPTSPRQPTTSRSWPAMSVLAMLALIGSLLVAGGMLIVLGAVSPLLFVGACLGGTAAAVGGASAGYLLHQHVRLRRLDER